MPKNTTKFFEQIASSYLTKIDIENYIKKITDNHEISKLQILKNDFQLFIDLYRGELVDNISDEMLREKIKEYEDKNIEIPINYFDAIIHKETGKVLFEAGKEIDLEKLFFPFEMHSLNQVNFYIDNLIKEHQNTKVKEPTKENLLKWHGTQTEFIELIKALIENGNIKGTQIEIISTLSNIFNVEIKHPNKLINDIKKRNNDSETLFLDKLKKSLFDYITSENKK